MFSGILIDLLAKAGQIDRAFRIFKTLEGGGVKMDVVAYTSLIDSFCKAGNILKLAADS